MANKTDPLALPAHGTDPQLLIEKITRERIYESRFWKERCFGLSVADLVHAAVQLDYIGGTFGPNRAPCPFITLLLKMLQLGPTLDVVDEFIDQTDFKYPRLLAAAFIRLAAPGRQVYAKLEPLLADYRKIVLRTESGYELTHVDSVIDSLLTEEDAFGIKLPRLPLRHVLADVGQLPPRASALPVEDLVALGLA